MTPYLSLYWTPLAGSSASRGLFFLLTPQECIQEGQSQEECVQEDQRQGLESPGPAVPSPTFLPEPGLSHNKSLSSWKTLAKCIFCSKFSNDKKKNVFDSKVSQPSIQKLLVLLRNESSSVTTAQTHNTGILLHFHRHLSLKLSSTEKMGACAPCWIY